MFAKPVELRFGRSSRPRCGGAAVGACADDSHHANLVSAHVQCARLVWATLQTHWKIAASGCLYSVSCTFCLTNGHYLVRSLATVTCTSF
ncbi:unnamed protein product [Ixodes pacificus]